MVRTADMARELTALVTERGYAVFAEAPRKTDGEPFIYLRLHDMRDGTDAPGICTRNIRVEIICSGGERFTDEAYYDFYDMCTALFLPYVRFCGRNVMPKDIQSDKSDGVGRYTFRLEFTDDVEPLYEIGERAEDMRELILKEEM